VKQLAFFIDQQMSSLLLASIKELTAKKICVTSKGIVECFQCIQCNYTETFQRQVAVAN